MSLAVNRSWQSRLLQGLRNPLTKMLSFDLGINMGWLLAVPKKKTSHMKKRQRMLGPHGMKNAKYLNNLNRCPSCGHYKRMNTLCMHCVNEIKFIWKNHLGESPSTSYKPDISAEDYKILYPGKKDTAYIKKLKDKDSYLKKRLRTLPVESKDS